MRKTILSMMVSLSIALGFTVQAPLYAEETPIEETQDQTNNSEILESEETNEPELVITSEEPSEDNEETEPAVTNEEASEEDEETENPTELVYAHVVELIENAERDESWKENAKTALASMEEEDLEDIEEESDDAILAMFDLLFYGEVLPAANSYPYYYFEDTIMHLTKTNVEGSATYWGAYTVPENLHHSATDIVIEDEIQLDSYQNFFSGFSSVSQIEGLDKLDTSQATSLNSMFYGCESLTSLDLSHFNTENVTDMSNMFYNCAIIATLDFSSFNTEKVVSMARMFNGCTDLTSVNLSSFRTENVTSLNSMFNGCKNLTTLDLSHFSTDKVTSMYNMFYYCENLQTLKVANWNTEKVTDMSYIFYDCSNFEELDLSGWTISSNANTTEMVKNVAVTGYIKCPKSGGEQVKPEFLLVDDDGNKYTNLSASVPVKIDALSVSNLIYDPTSGNEPVHGQILIKGPYLYRYFKQNDGFKGWTVSFMERYRWNPHLLDEIQSERYLSYTSYRTTAECAEKIKALILDYLNNNEPITTAPALTASASDLHGENIISLAEMFKVDARYLNTSDWSTQYGGIHRLADNFKVPATADVTEMFQNAVYIEELPQDFILPDRSDFRGLFANAVRLDPFKNGLSVSNEWYTIDKDLECSFSRKGAIYATSYPSPINNVDELDAFYNTGFLLPNGLTVKNFDSGSLMVYSLSGDGPGGASRGFGNATRLENVTTLYPEGVFHFRLNIGAKYALLDNENLRSIKNLTVYNCASGAFYHRNEGGVSISQNVTLLNTQSLESIDGLTVGEFDGGLFLSCNENLKDVKNIKIIPRYSIYPYYDYETGDLIDAGTMETYQLTKENTRGLFSTTPNVNQIQIHIEEINDNTFEAVFPDLSIINPDLSYDNEQWQWYLDDKALLGETGKTITLTDEQVKNINKAKLSVKYVNSLTVGAIYYDLNDVLPNNFILNPPSKNSSVSNDNANAGIATYGTGVDYAALNANYVILSATYTKPVQVKIQKTDMDGKVLTGAQLSLSDSNNGVTSWTSEDNAKEFKLYPGTYTLTEQRAPQGYDKVTSEMKFVIDDEGALKITADSDNGKTMFVMNNGILELRNMKTEEAKTNKTNKTSKAQVPNTCDNGK